MATFANQSSNLSALKSALSSFSTVLDVSENATSSLTRAEEEENARLFLKNQAKRVDAIDESLLRATEHVLPISQEAKTATELAELCRLVQEATRQKMGLLRTRLDLLGIKVAWSDSILSPNMVAVKDNITNSARTIEWSVGGPLDCVVEGDVETEGATTPGSLLIPSPSASATKRKTSLTPTTPTMDKFSFSSSTASILGKMNQQPPSSHFKSLPGSKSTPSPSGRSRADRLIYFEGFRDDDDMISLNTTIDLQSASAKKRPPSLNGANSKSPLMKMREERSQFLERMESMLERVEEDLIYESRPSDETCGIASRRSSVSNRLERPSNNKFLEELEENDEDSSAEDDDDDSTNMIATLVAEKSEPLAKDIKRPVPVIHRPTHILVDTAGLPSPSHTNITMDATMMNETMMSTTMLRDDDNDSTVTPVLDRYRLDADDNSIGVKVVPNKRGKHSQKRFTEVTQTCASEGKSVEYEADQDGFLSPKGLPGSVSARTTKQYRKTPYPKKQLEQNFDDENHPNTRAPVFSPASSMASFKASNPESSFSVPPLRPRSLGPSRTTATPASMRTQSLPTGGPAATLPKTPSLHTKGGLTVKPHSFQPFLEKITMGEYNMAPRVVQMQVTREETNQSIDALEALFALKIQSSQPLEFLAEEGYRVLTPFLRTEQKSKSVIMSLCHWRRLLMHRQSNNSMLFALNKFDQKQDPL